MTCCPTSSSSGSATSVGWWPLSLPGVVLAFRHRWRRLLRTARNAGRDGILVLANNSVQVGLDPVDKHLERFGFVTTFVSA